MSVLKILILEAVGLQIRPSRLSNCRLFQPTYALRTIFYSVKNVYFVNKIWVFFKNLPTYFRPFPTHAEMPRNKGFRHFWCKISRPEKVGRYSRLFLQNALPFCNFALQSRSKATSFRRRAAKSVTTSLINLLTTIHYGSTLQTLPRQPRQL